MSILGMKEGRNRKNVLNTQAQGPQVAANVAMNKQVNATRTLLVAGPEEPTLVAPTINWQMHMMIAPNNNTLRRPARSTSKIPGTVMATLTTPVATVIRYGCEIPADLKKAVP